MFFLTVFLLNHYSFAEFVPWTCDFGERTDFPVMCNFSQEGTSDTHDWVAQTGEPIDGLTSTSPDDADHGDYYKPAFCADMHVSYNI